MQAGSERRHKERKRKFEPAPLRVKWKGESGEHDEPARLTDVSPGGFGVDMPVSLPAGTEVYVTGELTEGQTKHKVASDMRVAWCRPNNTLGFSLGLAFFKRTATPDAHEEPAEPAGTDEADFYEVLQLSISASPETIHRVFRILAQQVHPDNAETGNEAEFRRILEAYQVLGDPARRAAYDARLAGLRKRRWKLFERAEPVQGANVEKRKRQGILLLLYNKRLTDFMKPSLTLHELETLLSCPKEHLEFSLWYLKENHLIARADNARFTITAKGVDHVESSEEGTEIRADRMLPAPAKEAPDPAMAS